MAEGSADPGAEDRSGPAHIDTDAAGLRLVRSKRVQALLRYLFTAFGVPACAYAFHWLEGTARREDLIALRVEIVALRNDLAKATAEQQRQLSDLQTERVEQASLRRAYVVVRAALVATEGERTRQQKLAAGERVARAYDRLVGSGVHPAAAAETVLGEIAVP